MYNLGVVEWFYDEDIDAYGWYEYTESGWVAI